MRLALRLAVRDLRGGLGALRLLAVSLLIGTAALAGVGSLSAAILSALSAQGREILGGDLVLSVAQREADPAERAAFARTGTVSTSVKLRAMAIRDGGDSLLAELKGVDGRYPLYGRFRLVPGALAPRPGPGDVAVAPALAERLRLRPGDRLRFGEASLRVVGVIAEEPDRVGEGFSLGPAALVDMATLRTTGLLRPGSLFEARYRIRTDAADPDAAGEALQRRFPLGGWEMRDRENAAPGLRRFVSRLGQFLTLLGLAALAVAGIGVGNGVASWLDGKRQGIAVLKALGAESGTVFRVYLAQVALVASGAVLGGLLIGWAVPPLVGLIAGDALPVRPDWRPQPVPLLVAAAYGCLVALLVALPPLARARAVTAAGLFRGGVEPVGAASLRVRAAQALLAALIVALALAGSRDRALAAGFLGGTAALLLLLALIGLAIRRTAARLPRPRRPLARLALANLHRPGAPTARLVTALGLGLTLFAALAAIESSLAAAIRGAIPARAPSFFVLDIPKEEVGRFRATVGRSAPGAAIVTVPLLRGSVTEVAGRRVADMKELPPGAWILRGDRGLTFADRLPAGNTVVAGRWWEPNYAGPPLVSIDAEAARALGLKVGDTMTLSVLGVEIPAHIASFREIRWDTMGFNFAIIFSPGALEGAPFSWSATIDAPAAAEPGLARALARDFPASSAIRVRDVIGQVSDVLGQMAVAIRAAGGVAAFAGIVVLVGAVVASRRQRSYDSVLLKLLGATRGQVLAAQALEFGGLAVLLALVALVIGAGAGWYVVTGVLGLDWAPDWSVVALTLTLGAGMTVVLGLLAALPSLNARPAAALRDL